MADDEVVTSGVDPAEVLFPHSPGSYGGLESASRGLIDFDLPPGLTINYNASITSRFSRVVSLMVPFPGVGFSYSTMPQRTLDGSPPVFDHWPRGGYFNLYGDVNALGIVQGRYMHRILPRWALSGMGVSTTMENSMYTGGVRYTGDSWTTRLKGTTEGRKVELSAMKGVTSLLAVGGEVSHSFDTEKWAARAGSVGVRYKFGGSMGGFPRSQVTGRCDHKRVLRTSFTTQLYPGVNASSRYKLDTNTLQSDVGVGIEWQSSSFPMLVKAKADSARGFGVMLNVMPLICMLGVSVTYNPLEDYFPQPGLYIEV